MHLSFLTGLYYVSFCLLGLVSGYFLGFNMFQLLCEVFGVSNAPNWLNVAFAAGFGFVLSAVYLVIAAIFHGLRNVIYRLIDVMAEFVTRLIAVLYNKQGKITYKKF